MASYDLTLKVLLLGDSSTGKKEFIYRYISGFFHDDLSLTTGVDIYSKTLEFRGKKIKLQIWLFGGEQRFRFLLYQYCKGADGAIIMYDITDLKSLDHIPDWTQVIREHTGDIPILLVGNKLDLKKEREISKKKGLLTAKKYNLSMCVELSSKTGQNVEQTFAKFTKILIDRYDRINNEGAMNKLIDTLQIPDKKNFEKRPQLSDEDIRILDLESEVGIKLMNQYKEETGEQATEKGKETPSFTMWLKGFKVEKRTDRILRENKVEITRAKERQKRNQKTFENFLKIFEPSIIAKKDLEDALKILARVLSFNDKKINKELERIIENIKKLEDFDENTYPYSVILKLFSGDYHYMRNFILGKGKRRGSDDDRYPYPYVFKPPEPPDEIAVAPQSQVFAPSKDKDSEDIKYCQYCGRKLTKEEQITHSCKKKPEQK